MVVWKELYKVIIHTKVVHIRFNRQAILEPLWPAGQVSFRFVSREYVTDELYITSAYSSDWLHLTWFVKGPEREEL